MKKILVTTVLASVLSLSAFAQGTLSFKASASVGLIKYTLDGTTIVSAPTGASATIPGPSGGTLNIAFYSAAAGTSLNASGSTPPVFGAGWTEASTILHQIAPGAGNVPTSTIILGNVAEGASAQVEVVAWTGAYTDFASALAGGAMVAWSGSTLSGGSLGWTQATGAPNGTPPTGAVSTPTGAGGFNGLVLQTVPEPGTLALAGLGAASLLLFRRRK